MNHLHLIIPACALLTLAGCASTEHVVKDESILDVLDAAETAPPPPTLNGCPANLVNYCVQDGANRAACTCMDVYDVQSRASRFFR
jgi:hypothetical protein